ncbi:MAG: hypothetical protein RL217_753 [Pseudomonadota bacterium]|jgi:3-hydroxyisobutyrate dehydrogenase
MRSPRIGFIGMGLMGVPMSLRLLQAGLPLCVWNRNPVKTQSLQARGARVAATLKELSAHSDFIFLCVSNTQAVEEVLLHSELLGALRHGQVVVDFSSIAPDASQHIASVLAEKGVSFVDAPVSGGVVGAENGTLAIMAGGDAKLIETLHPVLLHLGARVTHMGPVGSGQITKICNQILVSCNVLVMAEVMALAERAGVNAARIPDALKGGFADSIPLQVTGPRMANKDFEPVKWHVKTLLKDLDMAQALARQMHSAVPMAGLGAQLMRLHASQGFSDSDPSTLVMQYEGKV